MAVGGGERQGGGGGRTSSSRTHRVLLEDVDRRGAPWEVGAVLLPQVHLGEGGQVQAGRGLAEDRAIVGPLPLVGLPAGSEVQLPGGEPRAQGGTCNSSSVLGSTFLD